MKIKLDENIPVELAEVLVGIGHETDTVPQEGLAGQPDTVVWRASAQDGRFLVTQDLDFSDIRRFNPGTHPGVLLVRLNEPSRSKLIAHIERVFRTEAIENWKGCLVVVTEHKIRIKHT